MFLEADNFIKCRLIHFFLSDSPCLTRRRKSLRLPKMSLTLNHARLKCHKFSFKQN